MAEELKTPKEKKPFKLNLKSVHIVFGADADKDWKFASSIFSVFALIVIGISLFLFGKFIFFSKDDEIEQGSSELINRQNLQKVIEEYDARALNFERLKNGEPLIDQMPKTDIVGGKSE